MIIVSNTTPLIGLASTQPLEVKDLSPEQAAGILAELGAEVVHLQAHTDGFQEVINDEIEKL